MGTPAMPGTGSQGRMLMLMLPVALVGVLLSIGFKNAVVDGLEHKGRVDMAVVAPDYEARDSGEARAIADFTLKDRTGAAVSLSAFAAADLLLINIWSSTCPACKEEVPSLVELDRRLPQLGKVVLLTIATDSGWEDVQSFFPQGTDLRVLFDPQEQVTKGIFGTQKFPETFVLDKQRRIRARFDGRRPWHSREMFDYLRLFL
ncbi:MAG: TlpA family protein disulfide reductase [Myxococcota bacterium]|nr:TlpA family protein disulfide reductase [Myxococcota bacterium]